MMHKSMLRKIDSDAQQYRYHKVIRSVWALSLGYLLLTTSAWSEVLVSWRQSELPAKPLGVSGLVIPFAPDNATKIQNATTQGYRVYIEVSLAQFAAAEKLAGKNSIAGLIIDTKDEQDTENKLQKLRADLIANFAGRNAAHVRLRPAGRVALEWARLQTETGTPAQAD